jgi:GntR family transcriptional regulator
MEIDRKSHVPVYWQIKEDLHRQIMQGEILPKERIPSEPKLAESYGVSRLTARNAVTELVNEGYLQRVHGQGTYVTKPKFEESGARFSGFFDTMTRKGYKVSSRVLTVKEIIPDPEVKEQLKLAVGQMVYRIKRLRFAGKEPIGIQDVYLPAERCRGITDIDLENDSIYRFLEEEKLFNLKKAKEKLEAVSADEGNAELLGIRPGDPVLYTRRLTTLSGEIPIEYSRSWYRGDSYVFEVDIT